MKDIFGLIGADEYRTMDADGLSARRDLISAILEGIEPMPEGVEMSQLAEEAGFIKDEYERRNEAIALRNLSMRAVEHGEGRTIEGTAATGGEEPDMFDTAEYRDAFMAYVQHGTAIPAQFRDDEYTTTSDVSPMIPVTMGREIVRKMSEYGDIWNRVRKVSVQGGLWFRVLDLQPTATWIDEDTVSDTQKVESSDKISFSFYELECRMSQTLLASATTFADFQALFVPAVAEAMVRALEQAIVRGSGDGQPLGFTVDPRVTNTVEMTAEDMADWTAWHKKVKAAMPKAYRNGEFIMAQSTWDTYIETLASDDNAPVSIGYNPVTGEEEYRLMGKPVTTVEDDILPDFDAADDGAVVAAFCDLDNYLVNTQPGMPMSTVRWIDHDENKEKIKSLMACDGKVLDPYGFVLVSKGASA